MTKWKNAWLEDDVGHGGAAGLSPARRGQTLKRNETQLEGFTLIELLVVIAIIAVLASLLLPALARAKGKAHSIKCISQFKQLGIATELYVDDNEGQLPGNQHALPSWVGGLITYVGASPLDGSGGGIYRCPVERGQNRLRTYAVNDFLTYRPPKGRQSWPDLQDFSRKLAIPSPADTFWMGELAEDIVADDHFHFVDKGRAVAGDGNAYQANSFFSQVNVLRHQGRANYLFADGHVESLAWTYVKPTLSQQGSKFAKPDGHKP